METLTKKIPELFERVQKSCPVIESITNVVTVNDCANIVLASNGAPTMAEHKDEVEEIQANCHGLVLNIGNIAYEQQEAMIRAGKVANQLRHPIVLDPVGAGASKMRNDAIEKLFKQLKIQAVRGNISEIKAIASFAYSGELANDYVKEHGGGTGMFRMALMDAMSNMTPECLLKGLKVEKR